VTSSFRGLQSQLISFLKDEKSTIDLRILCIGLLNVVVRSSDAQTFRFVCVCLYLFVFAFVLFVLLVCVVFFLRLCCFSFHFFCLLFIYFREHKVLAVLFALSVNKEITAIQKQAEKENESDQDAEKINENTPTSTRNSPFSTPPAPKSTLNK
jgi:hypothetical protein